VITCKLREGMGVFVINALTFRSKIETQQSRALTNEWIVHPVDSGQCNIEPAHAQKRQFCEHLAARVADHLAQRNRFRATGIEGRQGFVFGKSVFGAMKSTGRSERALSTVSGIPSGVTTPDAAFSRADALARFDVRSDIIDPGGKRHSALRPCFTDCFFYQLNKNAREDRLKSGIDGIDPAAT